MYPSRAITRKNFPIRRPVQIHVMIRIYYGVDKLLYNQIGLPAVKSRPSKRSSTRSLAFLYHVGQDEETKSRRIYVQKKQLTSDSRHSIFPRSITVYYQFMSRLSVYFDSGPFNFFPAVSKAKAARKTRIILEGGRPGSGYLRDKHLSLFILFSFLIYFEVLQFLIVYLSVFLRSSSR